MDRFNKWLFILVSVIGSILVIWLPIASQFIRGWDLDHLTLMVWSGLFYYFAYVLPAAFVVWALVRVWLWILEI